MAAAPFATGVSRAGVCINAAAGKTSKATRQSARDIKLVRIVYAKGVTGNALIMNST
jgi:hypothetical protein